MKDFNRIQVPENLEEILDPAHCCLVIWDVQNGLVQRVFNRDAFEENLGKLLEALRPRMLVFYTRITPPPGGSQSPWGIYSAMRRAGVDDPKKIVPVLPLKSPAREFRASVGPAPGDIVLDKTTADIFLETKFEDILRQKRITTILFTGIATEMGVENSARNASLRGFFPVIVSDCVSSMDVTAHERSLANLARQVLVEESRRVLKALKAAPAHYSIGS